MLLDEGTSLRLRDPLPFREIRYLVGFAATLARSAAPRFVLSSGIVVSPRIARR